MADREKAEVLVFIGKSGVQRVSILANTQRQETASLKTYRKIRPILDGIDAQLARNVKEAPGASRK